jgi:hypothetical protein
MKNGPEWSTSKASKTASAIARGSPPHRMLSPAMTVERGSDGFEAELISSKMLGGASQTVSKIRVKCNGT